MITLTFDGPQPSLSVCPTPASEQLKRATEARQRKEVEERQGTLDERQRRAEEKRQQKEKEEQVGGCAGLLHGPSWQLLLAVGSSMVRPPQCRHSAGAAEAAEP